MDDKRNLDNVLKKAQIFLAASFIILIISKSETSILSLTNISSFRSTSNSENQCQNNFSKKKLFNKPIYYQSKLSIRIFSSKRKYSEIKCCEKKEIPLPNQFSLVNLIQEVIFCFIAASAFVFYGFITRCIQYLNVLML